MTTVSTEKRNFDTEAASWDQVPARVKLAGDVARAISQQITLTSDLTVLDFGCGTGLLTLQLRPWVGSITGVDSSQGMLDILNAKIEKQNLSKIRTQYLDLDTGTPSLAGQYQLIVSNMTLHHVKDIGPLLDLFHQVTAPGGHLCIADLDLDDGQFHSSSEGVFHFGFDRTALAGAFTKAGFDEVRHITATEVVRPDSSGAMRAFTVFLMIGRKKG